MKVHWEDAKGTLTNLAGLDSFRMIWNVLGMGKQVKELLPNHRNSASILKRNMEKFDGLLFGFLAGADCIDDMAHYNEDAGFQAATHSSGYTPKTYGEFLRSFDKWHVRKFNELLLAMAKKIRENVVRNDSQFILDIDSTTHRQYGKKMEGVGYNYNNVWGLDSIQAFDQYGIQYWMQLREGGTFTANNASTIIQKVFKGLSRKYDRYLRADSGFCNHDVFRECADYDVSFVVAGRANMYYPLVNTVRNWRKSKGVFFRDGRPAEIGSSLYYQAQNGRETLRVVIIRAKKKQRELFDPDPYDYRAWFTNLGEHEKLAEDVVNFYAGRGNAENFIKELKNGFDIHHFPCQKLIANQIYGLIAAFAYNLLRLASLTYNPKKFHFSKKLRFRLVYVAAWVVKRSRQLIYRVNHHQRKEVNRWLTTMKIHFGYS